MNVQTGVLTACQRGANGRVRTLPYNPTRVSTGKGTVSTVHPRQRGLPMASLLKASDYAPQWSRHTPIESDLAGGREKVSIAAIKDRQLKPELISKRGSEHVTREDIRKTLAFASMVCVGLTGRVHFCRANFNSDKFERKDKSCPPITGR
jgi:hypothetical protein